MTSALAMDAQPRRPFTAVGVADAPNHPGIYELFRGPILVLIGKSSDLHADLEAHRRGDNGTRTRSASHYRFEELNSSESDDRQAELLAGYRRSHNSNLPIGNRADVTGS